MKSLTDFIKESLIEEGLFGSSFSYKPFKWFNNGEAIDTLGYLIFGFNGEKGENANKTEKMASEQFEKAFNDIIKPNLSDNKLDWNKPVKIYVSKKSKQTFENHFNVIKNGAIKKIKFVEAISKDIVGDRTGYSDFEFKVGQRIVMRATSKGFVVASEDPAYKFFVEFSTK